MSIDHYCYVQERKVIRPGLIVDDMFVWVFLNDDRKDLLNRGRALPDSCCVVGSTKLSTTELTRLATDLDSREVSTLFKKEALGICNLRHESPIDDLEYPMDCAPSARYKNYLKSAIRLFETNCSASGNVLSVTMQRSLCECIAKLNGGIVWDPQNDDWTLFKPKSPALSPASKRTKPD